MVVSRLKERFFSGRRSAGGEDVFDADFFSRLDRLRLRFGRARGARAGETVVRGLSQPSGIEVESFKTYSAGDDIRYVDWNAVGRLDQLLTRRFVAEREIPLHLLLDASASMAVPAADQKFAFAKRLAAALAYVALNNNESVRITGLRQDGAGPIVSMSRLLRHRARYFELKPFLTALPAGGGTALREGIAAYLERQREGGVAFVVSDFLVEKAAYESAFERLLARRFDVRAIHVLGRGECELTGLRGRYRLRDAETGKTRDVELSEGDRRRYRRDLDERTAEIRAFCLRNGIGHATAFADEGVEHCLTVGLSAQGMLRLR
jgi:uncharacterized protein (DUF58 family)